jgi:ComF family protein
MGESRPNLLRRWTEVLLGFFYPEVCALCGGQPATHREGFVCAQCWRQVRFIRPPFCEHCGLPFEGEITASFECSNCRDMTLDFVWARSAVAARGPVLEAVHRYKYQRQMWFETFLAGLLVREAAGMLREEKWDGLVPVPLFFVREREREFNQAERLARRLSSATGIPVENKLLRRVIATPSQTRLSKKQRSDNMRNAFALRGTPDLEGRSYVVIDDVLTTGATTNACAKLLRKAGAERVAVWTVARGI